MKKNSVQAGASGVVMYLPEHTVVWFPQSVMHLAAAWVNIELARRKTLGTLLEVR